VTKLAKLIAVAAVLMTAQSTLPARAQSFNCNFAKTPDEVLICQNRTLSEMDEKLANLYFGLHSHVYGRDRVRMEVDQTSWLRHRMSCGRDVYCIAVAYQRRVRDLYHDTPWVCSGPILKQPGWCDPGGANSITDEDVNNTASQSSNEMPQQKQPGGPRHGA
jgi:uncharacterized protein